MREGERERKRERERERERERDESIVFYSKFAAGLMNHVSVLPVGPNSPGLKNYPCSRGQLSRALRKMVE